MREMGVVRCGDIELGPDPKQLDAPDFLPIEPSPKPEDNPLLYAASEGYK
jgi:hypothetical protein